MGSSDIPPAHAPEWLIPVSSAFLGVGFMGWNLTYILMTRRAIKSKSYGSE
jgi:hypothetical protein